MTESIGVSVNIAVEGDLDEAVLRRVMDQLNIPIERIFGKKGKDNLRSNIRRYNKAAAVAKWIVLVDLNQDADCPPPFVSSWLPQRNTNLQLRVAVRAIEAWLLADRSEIARFLKVSALKIPPLPEKEKNPKMTIINIARRSRSKRIQEDIVPRPYSASSQGPGYTSRMIEFSTLVWDPGRAAQNAPSLKRSLDSLSEWYQP